ncbi:MAG: substrate-binding domain-containing protein [Bradyrhizobium sp.]|uniref:substrate-binding domain-containing protein n=1 Tax=Bradyrhizobium sp. TaxID=376 RepID=UPI003D1291D7
MSADITGISSMATRQLLAELAGAYRQRTGKSVAIESVGGVDAAKRIRSSEKFDVVVLAADAMQKLEADGFLKPGSRAGLAESSIAVAVRAGSKRPNLSSETTTKAAVLAAQSVGYSTGPSGTHILKLLEKWGVDPKDAKRVVQAPPGVPVGTLVARGDVELGFQQLSEFLGVAGIEVAGLLPGEIQSVTLFACGVGAQAGNEAGARDLIGYLTSPETGATKTKLGMEPPRRAG